MTTLQPYIYSKDNKGLWHSFFAIKLSSISTFDPSLGESHKEFAFRLLNRQIDLINSLDCTDDDRTFELRIICHPDKSLFTRGTIDVAIISKVAAGDEAVAVLKAKELFHDLWTMLSALSDCYEFECVSNKESFTAVYDPFRVASIVEIMRREDIIEIETAKRLRGFGSRQEDVENDKNVYFVYPFIWSDKSLARLCTVLLFQENPCFLSVCLKPAEFDHEMAEFFHRQIYKCEKYLTGAAGSSPVNERITFITRTFQSMLLRIEDSPFFMKIRIVGNSKIPEAVIDSVGVEITEHAGSPDIMKDVNDAYVFSGGYICRYMDDVRAISEDSERLKYMRFDDFTSRSTPSNRDRLARFLFDPNQANCAFRLPIPQVKEFPGIATRFYKRVLPPPDIPSKGIVIGRNVIHGQYHYVKIAPDDRRRHMYVVGQTGTGKSTLFQKMILQDITNGKGLALLDPHGELINELMPRIPNERVEDVIYVNFGDVETPIAFNMLEHHDVLEKDFVVDQMFEIFEKLYDLRQTGGPMFEQYMKNALYLIMEDTESGSTLIEVSKVFSEKKFREYKLSKCKNIYIKEFWEGIAERVGGEASLENMAPYITSKLSKFIYNNTIRNIISPQRSSIDMRKVMDEGKIILVDLCKGKLGNINSHFLGMILVDKILMAALSRRDVKEKEALKDFYLYVDEFQNLATGSFISILSEARKYKLNAILTNQYLTQVPPEIQSAINGNVGTIISFRVGMADAEVMEKEFFPVFTKFDLMNLPNWRACVSMLGNGETIRPFQMQTLPEIAPKDPAIEEIVRKNTKDQFAKMPGDIAREIKDRWSHVYPAKKVLDSVVDEEDLDSIKNRSSK